MYEYERFIDSDPYRYGVPDRNDDPEYGLVDDEYEDKDDMSAYEEWRATWKTKK